MPVCATKRVRAQITGESNGQVNQVQFFVKNAASTPTGGVAAVNPTAVNVTDSQQYAYSVVTGLQPGQYQIRAGGAMGGPTPNCYSNWQTLTIGARQATPPAPHEALPVGYWDLNPKIFVNGRTAAHHTYPITIPHDSSVVVSWSSTKTPCSLYTFGYNYGPRLPGAAVYSGTNLPSSGSLSFHHIKAFTLFEIQCGVTGSNVYNQPTSSAISVNPTDPEGAANGFTASCYAPCHPDGLECGAWNGTCNGTRTDISRSCTTWSNCVGTPSTQTHSCLSIVQGQVFDATEFASCPAPEQKTANAIEGVTVNMSSLANGQRYTVNTNATGSFTSQVVGGNMYQFSLFGSGTYDYSAPKLYCDGVTPVTASMYVAPNTNNYYPQIGVQFMADPWWQVEGGPIKALGTSGTVLRSLIPGSCVAPGCQPFLIRNLNGLTSEGFVLTGGGNIDVSSVVGSQSNQIDQGGHNWLAKLQSLPEQEDYAYFYRLLQLPSNPQSDFGAAANNAAKPTDAFANNGAKAYFHAGDLTVEQVWNVDADEQVMVVVNGNVQVNRMIQVAPGGFLMFVASGDIVFHSALGHSSPVGTEAVVEGVFVADGWIRFPSRGTTEGGDYKFVGEGTFVGWSGIDLERDYDNGGGRRAYNNLYPTEVFRYRPDFLLNAPETIKRARHTWQEINP